MKTLRAPFLISVSLGAAAASGCGSSQGEITANPPPLTACPVSAPAPGEPCSGPVECHYGSESVCDADYQDFRCVNGAFDLLPRPSCNPPMPPRPEPVAPEPTTPVPGPTAVPSK